MGIAKGSKIYSVDRLLLFVFKVFYLTQSLLSFFMGFIGTAQISLRRF